MTTENKPSQTAYIAIAVEPVLTTVLTKQQKKELLEKSQFTQRLSGKQIWNLCCWEIFKPKKINKFYEMIQKGKAARFAYEDALHSC